tara:strand:+ start:432 stop:620 length:189 start_codon:yes stop_codon:yes gene_type:complete
MRANHQRKKERNKPSQDVHYGLSRLVSSACDRFFENRGMSKPAYNGVPKKSGKEDTNKDKKR